MRSIDRFCVAVLPAVCILSSCSTLPPAQRAPVQSAVPVAAPSQPQTLTANSARAVSEPAAKPARNWDEYKLRAAQRLVWANPQLTYMSEVQQPLLAIPVLEVELNADGTVQRIKVLREPTQAEDTVQLAMDAVKRAAPFGEVRHLPKPWKFTEVFLFDDNRRFKPRTLDD